MMIADSLNDVPGRSQDAVRLLLAVRAHPLSQAMHFAANTNNVEASASSAKRAATRWQEPGWHFGKLAYLSYGIKESYTFCC